MKKSEGNFSLSENSFYKKYTLFPLYKFWRNVLVGALSFSLLLIVFLTQTHLAFNATPSLPYKVFFCIKGLTPQHGDFVHIQNHPTAYFEDISYTKRLIGFPREKIHLHENQLYVNDILIGPLQQTTKDDKPLHPLKQTLIPEGYVFVSTDHPRSFDSRYEEFGLVKQDCLIGRCFGLWPSEALFGVQSPVFRKDFQDLASENKDER